MNYNETVEYLFSRLPAFQRVGGAAYKEGLDNSLALDQMFCHPHTNYKTIHVGGTNGKGSCSHLLAAVLQQSRYKVGLYTSPHLLDFGERIRVDGQMIDPEYVIDFVERYHTLYEPLSPSFFELTMMMAFCYFAHQQVDVAVIEVGLGGRLDSTNIINPDLSVITNIGFDHMQFLGNTLEKIAAEKAGIIKPGIPVVIGEAEGEVKQVFAETASRQNAPIVFAQDQPKVFSSEFIAGAKIKYQTVEYPDLIGELGGLAQPHNTNTVLWALDRLQKMGYKLPAEAVYEGFEKVTSLTGLMGRWQVMQSNPTVVLDTGHNAHGLKYVIEQLKRESYDRLHIVLGVVSDKDMKPIYEMLPHDAVYYFAKANIHRAKDAMLLRDEARSQGFQGEAYSSVDEAVSSALSAAKCSDFVFVGGSNFTIAEALEFFDRD